MIGKSKLHKLLSIENITESTYILKFERNGMNFKPGQSITLGFKGETDNRPYSIYSSIHDDFIEVLIKEVINGNFSKRFRKMQDGEFLLVSEPFGDFTLDESYTSKHIYLIATGTGISPFHSFISSDENLDYTLIHGIRNENEQYRKEKFKPNKYYSCITSSNNGNFKGRVTDFLKINRIESNSEYFICGSYDMIDEVYDVLLNKGISKSQIKVEGYF